MSDLKRLEYIIGTIASVKYFVDFNLSDDYTIEDYKKHFDKEELLSLTKQELSISFEADLAYRKNLKKRLCKDLTRYRNELRETISDMPAQEVYMFLSRREFSYKGKSKGPKDFRNSYQISIIKEAREMANEIFKEKN